MAGVVVDGRFVIDPLIWRDTPASGRVDHASDFPESRQLKIYALDPSIAARDGAVAQVRVPFEPLSPGPVSDVFAVDMEVGGKDWTYDPVDLDAADVLRRVGLSADAADARFHAQMCYAAASLCRYSFCRALGRTIGWAYGKPGEAASGRLRLAPFGAEAKNAYYSRDERAVIFGYFKSGGATPDFPADKYVFTSLSSDVIAHEVTHALLDSVRPHFFFPSNPDLLAFHESFSDLIALFQRFHYPELVRAIVRRSGGAIVTSRLLLALAPEFARGAGLGLALRTFDPQAQDPDPTEPEPVPSIVYDKALSHEPHERGRVLTDAIFEAFATVVQRRIEPLLSIAGIARAGAPQLGEGRVELPHALVEQIVKATVRTAEQFRALCIRALDYCPPFDLELGEYLRAMVTSDIAVVREDPLGFREALVRAFRRRGLYPRNVNVMSESALCWFKPERPLRIPGLALSNLKFGADPGQPASAEEMTRQATILGRALGSMPELMRTCGLVSGSEAEGAEFDLPHITSIRPSVRVGADGHIDYSLVAQLVQVRRVRSPGGMVKFLGGATIHLDAVGDVTVAVRKRVDDDRRLQEQIAFMSSEKSVWEAAAGYIRIKPGLWRTLCVRGGDHGDS